MSRPGRIPKATMINMAPIRATDAERRRWKAAARRHGISLAEVARWAWDALDRGELEVHTTTVFMIERRKAKRKP